MNGGRRDEKIHGIGAGTGAAADVGRLWQQSGGERGRGGGTGRPYRYGNGDRAAAGAAAAGGDCCGKRTADTGAQQ